MSYEKTIKGDADLFEKPETIKFKNSLIITPVNANNLKGESLCYLMNSNSSGVKKYLKKVYVQDEDEAYKKLIDLASRHLFKTSLFYCIRTVNNQIPIGYINLNSPLATDEFDNWTVDFWLGEMNENKNIMLASLGSTLGYLQQKNVQEIYAFVHIDNIKSRKLLGKLGFWIDHQEQGGENRIIYKLKLN